nr:hypothetical protein [Sedimenticola selenatireducens]
MTVTLTHIDTVSGDITSVPASVTIAAGSTSATFDVGTFDDTISESGENYSVAISLPAIPGGGFENLIIGTGSKTTQIVDNDNAPASISGAVTLQEDTTYTFNIADFNFTDADSGDSLQTVRIDSIPNDGKLYLNGSEITQLMLDAGDVIVTAAQITSNEFTFIPDQHESGSNDYSATGTGDQLTDYASFNFSVSDGINWSTSPAIMAIDVTPVADAPTLDVNGTQASDGSNLIDLINIPSGIGLTKTVFSNVGGGALMASDTLEAYTDGLTGGVTTLETQPYRDGGNGPDNIPQYSVEVTKGLIYLEAGSTISFSGYNDDALLIELGGNTLISTTGDAWGNYDTSVTGTTASTGDGSGTVTTAGVFTVPDTGYYTLEMYIYNHSGPGDLSVNVSLNGAPSTPLDTTNFNLYTDISDVDSNNGQHSEFELTSGSDGGYFPIELNKGYEGTPIKLTSIDAALVDVDSSETLSSIVISAIPEGATLSDGTNSFTASAGNTTVDVSAWNLDSLTFAGTADTGGDSTVYTLTVTATSLENANGDTAQTVQPLVITVLDTSPVAANDYDVLGMGGVANGSVITGAGGAGDGADTLNTEDSTVQVTSVSGQSFSGSSLALEGDYGILNISQDGSYSYASNLIGSGSAGQNNGGWSGVALYGFVGGETPINASGPSVLLEASLLDATHAGNVNVSSGRAGISDTKINASGEQLVIDLGGQVDSAVMRMNDFGNSDQVTWYAFNAKGQEVGSGSQFGTNDDVTVTGSGPIQYIVLDQTSGSDSELQYIQYTALTMPVSDSFNYVLSDNDGDSDSAVLNVVTESTGSGSTPVANSDTNTVNEAGIDGIGSASSANTEVATGNLFANDTGLDDGGVRITAINGDTNLVSGMNYINTTYGQLAVNTNTGEYIYTLTSAYGHDGTVAENANAIESFTYVVTDGNNDSSSSALTINIVDDSPVSGGIIPQVIRPEPIDTILTIVFDKSGSMGDTVLDANGDPISRYDLAMRGVEELVNTYDSLGQVRVNVVMFDANTVGGVSSWFTNATDVSDYIDNYGPGGATDYDDPLRSLVADYTPPVGFTPDQSFAYFMSDGNPNTSTYQTEITNYETTWRGWADTVYDTVYSIGIGAGVSSTYLDMVASEKPDGTENTIIIPDESLLVSQLLDTIPQVQSGQISVSGSGLNSFIAGSDQPGQVLTVTIDNVDYDTDAVLSSDSYDRTSPEVSNGVLTVTTARGSVLQVNMDTGEYDYFATADNNGGNDFKEIVRALYADADGDTAQASATFLVNQTDGVHENDEILLYDSSSPIDGGVGFDTLIIPSNDDLDFSGINNLSNIERVDLSYGDHELINLSINDVIDMTDGNNQLEILGENSDAVSLSSVEWQATGSTVTQNGHQFTEYQDSGSTVTLLIEDTVNVTIV